MMTKIVPLPVAKAIREAVREMKQRADQLIEEALEKCHVLLMEYDIPEDQSTAWLDQTRQEMTTCMYADIAEVRSQLERDFH
jgi:hypothetical protein